MRIVDFKAPPPPPLYDNINRALINHRDKGGYCPLDYAAMNNYKEVIELLLDNGADIRRENKSLVAKRDDILSHVTDPECYRILYAHVKDVRAVDKVKYDELAEIQRVADEKERIRQSILEFDKRRETKRQEKLKRDGAAHHKKMVAEIAEKQREDMKEVMGKHSGDAFYKYGRWERSDRGNWSWKKTELASKGEDLYKEGSKTMSKIREKYKFEVYNSRWKILTDGHELEVKWTKSDPFFDLDDEMVASAGKVDKFKPIEPEKLTAGDIEFKDENDELLDGENIDDLLGMLAK